MFETPHLEFGARRLPLMLQTEAAECGLACLAMVACHHGLRTDLPAMRARFTVSLKGANLAQIVGYADRLKLSSRALRLEMDELRDLKTPCLLHWDLNHFVVLRSASAKGIVIHDPAVGVRQLPCADVDKHFTGLALELTPSTGFRPATPSGQRRRRRYVPRSDRQRSDQLHLLGQLKKNTPPAVLLQGDAKWNEAHFIDR